MAKTTKTVEVIGVVDADGAGGGMSHGRLWLFGVRFSHWRADGGEIDTMPLYVEHKGTEAELDHWMRTVKPRNMLRMKVRFTGTRAAEEKRASLVEYLGKDASDKELRRAAKDDRPSTIEVPYFGTLRLDRGARRYSASTKWRRKPLF